MTTAKRPARAPLPAPATDSPARSRIRFPEFRPRVDMQNSLYLNDPGHIPALRTHFGFPDTTIVLGEVPIGWNATGERRGLRIPDLLIAFNIERAAVIEVMGYSINEHGKPPDFVLEIASPTTARRDEIEKPGDYAEFGVPEYCRFDHEWGRSYATGLAGDSLDNGVYQPIPIRQAGASMYWGRSAVLNLDVCWEHGELRFYDPTAQHYLDTYDTTHYARIAAEDARDAEQAARIAAESERDAAEAQVAELQAEIRRLRAAPPH